MTKPCSIYSFQRHLGCFQLFLVQTILIDIFNLTSKIRDHFTIPTGNIGKLHFFQKSTPLDINKYFAFATQVGKNKVTSCDDFNLYLSLSEGEHIIKCFLASYVFPFCECHVYIICSSVGLFVLFL